MEIADTYLSIAAPSEGLFKDNGSRFIALAFQVETEQQVKDTVARLRKEYHDARHHCYAFRLGYDASQWRSSDDGEPSGSAGRPILGQLESRKLSDTLVVVVRYFGGIKLGIPGLIRAYRTSTADALDKASVIEKTAAKAFRLHFDYAAMNDVMKRVKEMGLEVSSQDFGAQSCSLQTRVRLSMLDSFRQRMDAIARIEDL